MYPKSKQIYLIDDDDINNFLSKELISLYNADTEIIPFLTVDTAVKDLQLKIDTQQQFPDIILVDINMPLKNGWDFVEAFEKMDPVATKNTQIYIYTSSVYQNDIKKAEGYACIKKFITKPLSKKLIKELFGK